MVEVDEWQGSVPLRAIADAGLTFGVRQACNSHNVVRESRRGDPGPVISPGAAAGVGDVEQHRVERAKAVRELFLLDGDAEEAGWQERALCAQTDPEAFFPEKGGSTREAKKVCLTCEVRDDCLEYALMNDERFGIWGGLSERERRKLKKRAV
jgi:WhiB family transcriptional regulator, redox-sensing transcriptional regulator